VADQVEVRPLTVAVLGGTGDLGQGLVYRLASAGVRMIVGSRDAQRAIDGAAALSALVPSGLIEGAANDEASRRADLVIVAVPWAGHDTTLRELADVLVDKIVVDCVNPLGFDAHGAFRLDIPEGSAAQQAAALLPGSRVVAAFHNVSASMLMDVEVTDLAQDVLVLGDRRGAHPGRPDARRARRLRWAAAQRRSGRGAHREPDRDQPSLQDPLRHPHHRSLIRLSRTCLWTHSQARGPTQIRTATSSRAAPRRRALRASAHRVGG